MYMSVRRIVPVAGRNGEASAVYRVGCGAVGEGTVLRIVRSPGEPQRGPIARRLAVAVAWTSELDGWASDRLSQGREISIALPRVLGNHGFDKSRPKLGRVLAPLVWRRRKPWPYYPYQREGVKRLLASPRFLLADDMGLGKTFQVVVAATKLIQMGYCRRVLIVVPASLLETWKSEFRRWSPSVSVRIAGGGDADSSFGESWNVAHVLVTNYEQMRRPPREVLKWPPGLVVLDEAHRVKNWKSQLSVGLRMIESERIWALTGTPLERDKLDIVGLMGYLKPGVFGSRDSDLPSWMLRAKLRPYALRREKADVLAELPAVTYRHERVVLGVQQRRAYEAAKTKAAASRNVLSAFTRLCSLCDYDPESGQSAKIDRAIMLLKAACLERRRKAVVFSYTLRPLDVLRGRLRDASIPFVGVYSGKSSSGERTKMLADFARLEHGALIASLRAAGEGLTLTEANHVLLINRWWNPSANAQAIDRVRRIGQRRAVTVYYLEAEDTIDSRLSDILAGKEELFDTLVSGLAEPRELLNL